MKLRQDLLDADSPAGIEVIQITTEPAVPWSHIYMEAQISTPDSQRFLLHRSAGPHGGRPDDPEHRYFVCDIGDDCALSPVTEEMGATAPSVTPDGRTVYYFVDETVVDGGRLTLKRVNLDGTGRETVLVLDGPLPDTTYRLSRPYPLSTISSDGRRLALSGFLGDGACDQAPWGLAVFDLERAAAQLILHGPSWCNVHPQYSRSRRRAECRDILVQENHGCAYDAQGVVARLVSGAGADIHVIRDDGTGFRNMPWGRDGNEFCQGHQCWRGRSAWAITSTSTVDVDEQQLIEGRQAPHAGHVGAASPGALRNDLSRNFRRPAFYHFATDASGSRLVTDWVRDGRVCLYSTTLGRPGVDAAGPWTYLLCTGSDWAKGSHVHPFLSPDGTWAFFNSDESGLLQAYMIRGLRHGSPSNNGKIAARSAVRRTVRNDTGRTEQSLRGAQR